ncbi:TetR/AcrR family transcriptional regulator [Pseudonocardia nematodicida]|uniref:TetR/AcrR family transcriptional regulator n=1 Tax=Pseudonocardia nematodicida TaxID=1206997 RepID=A0ABV1KAT9_9PSEU
MVRTRGRLQDALLDLARERPLEAIAVADVAERAGVNRSSFYQHYTDKESLLADALSAQATIAGADLSGMVLADVGPEPPAALRRWFAHIADHAPLYRQALGGAAAPDAAAGMRRWMQGFVADTAHRMGFSESDNGLPLDVFAAGLTWTLLGVAASWLEHDPLPAPEVAAGWAWRMLVRRDF